MVFFSHRLKKTENGKRKTENGKRKTENGKRKTVLPVDECFVEDVGDDLFHCGGHQLGFNRGKVLIGGEVDEGGENLCEVFGFVFGIFEGNFNGHAQLVDGVYFISLHTHRSCFVVNDFSAELQVAIRRGKLELGFVDAFLFETFGEALA